jgi:hypothetical protein
MSETEIDGRLLQRWLRTDAAKPGLLVGCALDDGERDEPLPIVELDLARQAIVCADGKARVRIAFARLPDCLLVAPVGHPAVAAIQACVSPEEQRHQRLMRSSWVEEYPKPFASVDDLEVVHAAEMARREGKLPERALRGPWVRALKRNGLYRQGAQLAQSWRQLANAMGAPWSDIALHLAWFQRDRRPSQPRYRDRARLLGVKGGRVPDRDRHAGHGRGGVLDRSFRTQGRRPVRPDRGPPRGREGLRHQHHRSGDQGRLPASAGHRGRPGRRSQKTLGVGARRRR